MDKTSKISFWAGYILAAATLLAGSVICFMLALDLGYWKALALAIGIGFAIKAFNK